MTHESGGVKRWLRVLLRSPVVFWHRFVELRNLVDRCACEGGTKEPNRPKALYVDLVRCNNCGGFISGMRERFR